MPAGVTFILKALDGAPPAPFDREWAGRLLGEMASRAGVPREVLQKRPAPYAISSSLPGEGQRPASDATYDKVDRNRHGSWHEPDTKNP